MRSILWLSGLSLAALAACSPPEGTGFSGIGSEPQVASSSNYFDGASAPVPTGAVGGAYGHLNDSVPQLITRTKSANPGYNAEAAVLAANSKSQTAQRVNLNNQELLLSVVWVNKVSYAVLRPVKGTMRADTSRAFQANTLALTGCPAAGTVHTQDGNHKRDGVAGMSVQIACTSI